MKGRIWHLSMVVGATLILMPAAVYSDFQTVVPIPPVVSGANATSCGTYDTNPRNSCAARWANVSSVSSCTSMVTKIADQIPKLSASEKTSVEAGITRFLDKYKSAICLGKPVRACFRRMDRRTSPFYTAVARDGKYFLNDLASKVNTSSVSSALSTAVTNVNNSIAGVTNSNFLTKPLNDEKDLTIYNGYCPTGSSSAINLATATNVSDFLKGKNPPVKFGKFYVNYSDNTIKPSLDESKLKNEGLMVWYNEIVLDEDCVATGKVEFAGNQFNTVNQTSQIFTNLKSCVGAKIGSGFVISSVNIQASSSRLNNTQDAATAFCRKGFYALAKARGDAVKTAVTNVLGSSLGSAKITVDPSGTNGDGSSGPCPYRCQDPNSTTCTEELDTSRFSSLTEAQSKLQEYQFVRIGVKLKGTSNTPQPSDGKWSISPIRECYDLNIACGNSDVSCGEATPRCCTMDTRCCSAYQGTKCCNYVMKGNGTKALECVN